MVPNSWYEAPRYVSPKSSLFSIFYGSVVMFNRRIFWFLFKFMIQFSSWVLTDIQFCTQFERNLFWMTTLSQTIGKMVFVNKKIITEEEEKYCPHVSQITFNLDTEHPVFPYFSWLDTYCSLKVPNIAKIIDYTAKQGMLRSNSYPLEIVFFLNDICASVTNLISAK